MKKILASLSVALLAFTLMAVVSQPVQAAARPIYVQASVWDRLKDDLSSAEAYVESFTASPVYFGTCRAGYRCVTIVMTDLQSTYTAYTSWDGVGNARMQINRKNGVAISGSFYSRRAMFIHEFWHGLVQNAYHSDYCTNVMYRSQVCQEGSRKGQLRGDKYSSWAAGKLRQQ